MIPITSGLHAVEKLRGLNCQFDICSSWTRTRQFLFKKMSFLICPPILIGLNRSRDAIAFICGETLFKRWSVSVEKLSADSCPAEI